MAKKNKGLVVASVVGLGILLGSRKKGTTTTTNPLRVGVAPLAGSGGGGGSVYNPPTTGFVITGVGQTVTGLAVPQTVTLPVRVINLTATPAGIYSGSVALRTANGTVLHTETITDLNISSTGYPAIYFNPQNPVWNIPGPGTYTMLISFTIQGVLYSRSVEISLTNTDLGIVVGGNSGVTVQDYSVNNGNEVVLSLTGGTVGQSTTIQLKQGATVVGTLTAAYAASMVVNSSVYGYCDVFIDNTDLGGVYVPYQIAGTFAVERAKAVNDGILTLEINKVGAQYIMSDSANNGGWANVEYWHNSTFLGAAIPANYAVEPNIIHNLTKKVWGNGGSWISYDGDPNPKQKRQQTFKIVAV